jgi:hypothetical protein
MNEDSCMSNILNTVDFTLAILTNIKVLFRQRFELALNTMPHRPF